MNVINFHDINESGENRYYRELLKRFPEEQITVAEYDPYDNPADILFRFAADRYGHYDLIVGAGFGAVLALMFSRMKDDRIRTVLINPMYPFSKYSAEALPGYKYEKIIKNATEYDICWNKDILRNVYLILGKDDDITDTKRTPAYFFKENICFVGGGHYPEGEDFQHVFAELASAPDPAEIFTDEETGDIAEDKAYVALRDFISFSDKRDNPLFYVYSWDYPELKAEAVKLRRYEDGLSGLPGKIKFISSDEFPEKSEGLRSEFRAVSVLVIENVSKRLLNEKIELSLWITCDEVLSRGGRVLMLADSEVPRAFSADSRIADMVYDGKIGEFEGMGYEISWGTSSLDYRPAEDRCKNMVVDEISSANGNFVIRYHAPKLGEDILYLYFKDGKWYADEKEGLAVNSSLLRTVLENAAGKFADSVECVNRTDDDWWAMVW